MKEFQKVILFALLILFSYSTYGQGKIASIEGTGLGVGIYYLSPTRV